MTTNRRRPSLAHRCRRVAAALAWSLPGLIPGCTPPDASDRTPSRAVASTVSEPSRPPAPVPPAPTEPPPIRFRDASAESGVTFVHRSGNSSEKHFPTCLGSGLALLDYDGDGRLDLYFCSTCDLPLDLPNRSPGNRLFRNLGGGRFDDVTERAKVGFRGFNHGVAVGDVNNDGHPDLYLTNLGPNVLYLNNGDGTFRDATAGSGLECPLWSTGAAFLDYDNDGRLDLYVSNYGRWRPDGPRPFCGNAKRQTRSICSPDTIAPERHALYRNRGDGTFEDRTEAAGILRRDGRGMGVIASDLNGDGKIDLYVANDKCPNFLFLNRGDGTFEDAGESAGAACSRAGVAQGSMGVDAEDLDGDGRPELVVTNFRGEGIALYRNLGGGFLDIAETAGLVRDSKPYVGWGCALADFDGDGKPDLLAVNGHVDDNLPILGQDVPQAEPARSGGSPEHAGSRWSLDSGPFFATPHVARARRSETWTTTATSTLS